MALMRVLIALLFIFSSVAYSSAQWPLPDHVRPVAPAQTWTNNNPKVDFSGKGRIRGAIDGIYIGYGPRTLDGNHGSSCDAGRCDSDTSLRLSVEPDFSTPSGATSIKLKDQGGTLSGGIYKADGEVLLKSGNTLKVDAPSTLYAEKFTIDGGRINVVSGNPDDLVIVTTDDSEITDAGTINAHFVSEEYLMIKGTTVNGTVTTNELKIDEGGLLNGQPPEPPTPPEPPQLPEVCEVFKGPANVGLVTSMKKILNFT
ncbi:hypothetical protein JCM19233_1340 [Vibrio astriarenae]|nr:hypothetical protein JCM19233_1340 [Vibrio sp. C7]